MRRYILLVLSFGMAVSCAPSGGSSPVEKITLTQDQIAAFSKYAQKYYIFDSISASCDWGVKNQVEGFTDRLRLNKISSSDRRAILVEVPTGELELTTEEQDICSVSNFGALNQSMDGLKTGESALFTDVIVYHSAEK